ncbi:MAG: DUF4190 domain-containing protein [Armatimonadota bacterium]|nr:MAG: DUF4190 domain-containing protein [Armatimonadota bacterium]
MLCPKCGKEIPESTPYCAYCGEQFAQSAPPLPPVPRPRTSGLAIASLILGILGGFVVTALLGLIFGIIALVQIGRSQGRLRGQGLAIAGTVISGLGILLVPILAAMVFPVFARARASARKAICLSNVKNISVALQMYMADYDGRLPDADDWCGNLQEYLKNYDVLLCPAAKDLDCAYAYSSDLSGADLASFYDPPTTIVIFESDLGWNASGLPQDLLPPEPRHLGGDNFGFLDGHARWIARGSPLASSRFTD